MNNLQEKTFELLQSSGLNWTINSLPLFGPDGQPTRSMGNFRSDNGLHLGTTGTRYEPYQNFQMVELVLQAAEGVGIEEVNGGLLGNGERVFIQCALPDDFIGKSGIKRNITCQNSHDGSTSIGFGTTNTVIVCQNTFYRSMKDMQKVRHTITADDRLKVMMQSLRDIMGLESKLMDDFKRMADLKATDEMVERIVRKLFDFGPDSKEISGRKRNQIIQFGDDLTTEFALEGATAWGVFNAVTRYTNHSVNHKTEADKMTYIMQGQGADLSNIAFNELMQFVESNQAEYHFVTK